jgi:hypothetical protein
MGKGASVEQERTVVAFPRSMDLSMQKKGTAAKSSGSEEPGICLERESSVREYLKGRVVSLELSG